MFRASGNSGKTPSIIANVYPAGGFVLTPVNGVADQSYSPITTVTLPGGTMGPSSKLVIVPDWNLGGGAGTKTMAIDFGAANIGAPTATTSGAGKFLFEISNLGSLSSQAILNTSNYGLTPGGRLTSAINTANDVLITFKGKWSAAATDAITLLGYTITHYPGV